MKEKSCFFSVSWNQNNLVEDASVFETTEKHLITQCRCFN